ncbi:hypothetical protein Oscil6304_3100 [Oscillatoria acuminata PCC 6304]|uniref:Uncharacterized protein n=1 Tax=Oscillatoria acuminata PCC 6304 TaxID=56110 RepID=K9TJU6_9CYAN|nr:hypothetical protein Oscil6304_3100 [Oscillatoria acuminata PCC 6304]
MCFLLYPNRFKGRLTVASAEDVAEVSPNSTIGKEVTIRNQTAQAVGKSGFVMTPKESQPLLVINATDSSCLLKFFYKSMRQVIKNENN